MWPAPLQSKTYTVGSTSQCISSYMDTGKYCVKSSLKTQISPLAVHAGTPWPLKWKSTRSAPAARRARLHSCSMDCGLGSPRGTYLARGCRRSYCFASVSPICCTLFSASAAKGSCQHSRNAHGSRLSTSGGSTPMLSESASTPRALRRRSEAIHDSPS